MMVVLMNLWLLVVSRVVHHSLWLHGYTRVYVGLLLVSLDVLGRVVSGHCLVDDLRAGLWHVRQVLIRLTNKLQIVAGLFLSYRLNEALFLMVIFREDMHVTVNNFSLGNGGNFLDIRVVIGLILWLTLLMSMVLGVLVIGGDSAVLLEDGILVGVLLSELVAGLGLGVL